MRIHGLIQKAGVMIGASGLAMTALAGFATPAQATNLGTAIYSNPSGGATITTLSENCNGLLNGQVNNVVISSASPASNFSIGNTVTYTVSYPALPATTTTFNIRDCVVVLDSGNSYLGTLGEAEFDNAPNTSPFTFDVTFPNDPLMVQGNQICTVGQTVEQQSKAAAQQNRKTEVWCNPIVSPVLSLTKTANASPVTAGQNIGFTIVLKNTGGATANGVTLSDPLPAAPGVDWSATAPTTTAINGLNPLPTCSVTGAVGTQTLNCTAVNLPPTEGYQVVVTSATTAATTGNKNSITLNNTASAASTNAPAPTPASASIVVNSAAANQPKLAIVKTADPAGPVTAGSPIGFDITVTNTGNANATNVTVTDTLPTVATWASTAPVTAVGAGPTPTCSVTNTNPQTLSCTTVTLAGGGNGFTIKVTGTTPSNLATQVVSNTATATDAQNENVQSTATVTVNAVPIVIPPTPPAPGSPVLTLAKTADATPVTSPAGIGFVVTAANTGTADATGFKMTDPMPTNSGLGTWSIASVTPTGTLTSAPTCGFSGGIVSCPATGTMTLPAGGGFFVHIVNPVTSGLTGVVTNTASESATNATSPNPASAVVNVLAPPTPGGTPQPLPPDPTITKVADSTSGAPGGKIGYTITVTNPGVITTAAVVNDTLPANLAWTVDKQPSFGPACTIASGKLQCGPVDLPVNSTWSVHVTAALSTANCGQINNTAVLTASNLAAPRSASAAPVTVVCPLAVLGTQITPTTTAAPAATVAPATPAGPTLAFTGANTNLWMLIGLSSIVAGLILVVIGRKRQPTDALQA